MCHAARNFAVRCSVFVIGFFLLSALAVASSAPAHHRGRKTSASRASNSQAHARAHARARASHAARSSSHHSGSVRTVSHVSGPQQPGSSSSSSSSAASSTSKSTTKKKSKKRRSKREVTQKAPTPERISEIQSALARDGYYEGEPNGKWDAKTIGAMQKFQSANGIEPNGKLDAISLQKLGLGSDIAGVSAPKSPAPPSCCPSERGQNMSGCSGCGHGAAPSAPSAGKPGDTSNGSDDPKPPPPSSDTKPAAPPADSKPPQR